MIGVVLAGGRSSRMGQDKAQIRHPCGQTWLARSQQILIDAGCQQVFVSGRSGTHAICDPIAHQGPAAAIVHTWLELQRDYPAAALLFIPVDLPYLTPAALQLLVQSEGCDAACFESHPIPLLLHPTTNVKQRMQTMHAPQGASIKDLLTTLAVNVIALPEPHQRALTNVNRREDLL